MNNAVIETYSPELGIVQDGPSYKISIQEGFIDLKPDISCSTTPVQDFKRFIGYNSI